MSFTKNAEAEILANLGILTNQHSLRKGSHRDSITDNTKETSNRTRLLSSSDNDKSSLNFYSDSDSDDDGMVVFNNSNSLTNNYTNKIIKMSNWHSYLISLPIIFFMNYLYGLFHSLPGVYQDELYKFSSASLFGIGIGWYTSLKIFEKYNPIKIIIVSTSLAYIFLVISIFLTGFIQYIGVIIFTIQVFYFTKSSLLILISTSTDTKTFFLIYFFIALGGLIAPITMSNSSFYVTNVELKTQNLLTKRDISTIMDVSKDTKSTEKFNVLKNDSFNSDLLIKSTTNYINTNQSTKISKPDSVVGVSENQDKKTEENVLQRAAAEEKRRKNESEIQSSFVSTKSSTKTEFKSTGVEYSSTTTIFTTTPVSTTTTTNTTNKIIKESITTTTKLINKETEKSHSTTPKTTKTLLSQKANEKISDITTEKTKIIDAPYKVGEKLIIDKISLLEILLLVLLLSIIPSIFFGILHLLKIKKLPNDVMIKYIESKTYSSLPLKGIILSYIIWLLLSIIECTFAYCQINKLVNNNDNLFLPILPMVSLLFIRLLGIFYCKKLITKKFIHIIQIISIAFVGGSLFMMSNYKNNTKLDGQMNIEYLNGILGLLIGCIGPMYFNWISKMIQKQIITLLNHFVVTYLGSILVAKIVFTYLLVDIDEGKVENSLYIILMLLILLEITFAFLSLHFSSYYRQTEIARLTNSLSGNSRKQNGDISVKIKKNKYGYNRLVNEVDNNFDSLSLIVSDSDSNDEIFS